jgi:hypothetical protein
MRLDAGLKIGCFDPASFLRFGDFEGRAKRKMFDFVLARGRRKRRVTDTSIAMQFGIALLY